MSFLKKAISKNKVVSKATQMMSDAKEAKQVQLDADLGASIASSNGGVPTINYYTFKPSELGKDKGRKDKVESVNKRLNELATRIRAKAQTQAQSNVVAIKESLLASLKQEYTRLGGKQESPNGLGEPVTLLVTAGISLLPLLFKKKEKQFCEYPDPSIYEGFFRQELENYYPSGEFTYLGGDNLTNEAWGVFSEHSQTQHVHGGQCDWETSRRPVQLWIKHAVGVENFAYLYKADKGEQALDAEIAYYEAEVAQLKKKRTNRILGITAIAVIAVGGGLAYYYYKKR